METPKIDSALKRVNSSKIDSNFFMQSIMVFSSSESSIFSLKAFSRILATVSENLIFL
jgi:hypothetical protein